jgi:hypothetical protein
VEQRRPRFEASREQREQLATRFFAAADEGDLEALEQLLAHDVVLHGDGGGKAPALKRAVHGRARVARTLIGGLRALARFGLILRREQVNGQPGALVVDPEGRLIGVMILDVAEGQIQGVSSIVNPDKLRHLGPLGDLGALRRERSQILQRGMRRSGSDRPMKQPARERHTTTGVAPAYRCGRKCRGSIRAPASDELRSSATPAIALSQSRTGASVPRPPAPAIPRRPGRASDA